MGDGLVDGNWAVKVSQKREKILKLEQEFLQEDSDSTEDSYFPTQIHNILLGYLSMKKGSDSWAQDRQKMYQAYITGEISKKELLKYIE